MKSVHSFMKLGALVVLLTSIVSCGGGRPNVVEDIKVQTYSQDSDVYVSFDAKINLGNMQLPAINLPIINPKGGGSLGRLEMGYAAGGGNFLGIDFNLSEVTPLQASTGSLPNGGSLPLIGSNQVIEVNVGGSANVKIYISLLDGAQAIGVAIPIKAFDGIGGSIGSANVFPIFTIGEVIGSAGLFTGSSSGQNGLGVFVDLTNLLDDVFKRELNARVAHIEVGARSAKRVFARASQKGQLNYNEQKTSSSKQKKIDKMIYKLHKKKKKLSLR